MNNIRFRNYRNDDYELVRQFLIELNKDRTYINWHWGRFEWMMEHPYFDKPNAYKIGLWFDEDKLVGTAIFDMYFGEASCLTLPNYEYLYGEIIDYAYSDLKDENGLGIAVNINKKQLISKLISHGFVLSPQKETIMEYDLSKVSKSPLPIGYSFYEPTPEKDIVEVQWVMHQGFENDDYNDFLKKKVDKVSRPNFNPYLNLMVKSPEGEMVAYCSLWFDKSTDHAYLEPLCVIPKARKLGIAKALVYELLNRVKSLGARKVYVISDMEFYSRLGFEIVERYSFYWKRGIETERLLLVPITIEMIDSLLESDEVFLNRYGYINDGGEYLNPSPSYLHKIRKRMVEHPEEYPLAVDYLIIIKDIHTVIGTIYYKSLPVDGVSEIGYGIKPTYEGHGYMSEALTKMLEYGKNNGVKQVVADTITDNKKSQNVLTRCGFKLEKQENDTLWYRIIL